MCISGCPYKKPYLNWTTGKSEKCILCYPRLESGFPPACFHACVGRIRFVGAVLYDAERIKEAASALDRELVDAQREIIQNPFDPEVIAAARENGISNGMIDAAQKSPVYKFVKLWKIALPLHPEFRTLPMLFYIPPMLPVMASVRAGLYGIEGAKEKGSAPMISFLEQARVPLRFMANLLTAGNEKTMEKVYRKLIAVRVYTRATRVKDVPEKELKEALDKGETTPEETEAIFRLTSMPTFEERFVLPPLAREMAIEAAKSPFTHKAEAGFGTRQPPERGW